MEVLDVTRLQKMNQLANTLNKHRLVSNKMEAAELASDIAGRSSEQALGRLDIDDHQRFIVRSDVPKDSKDHTELQSTHSNPNTLLQEAPSFSEERKRQEDEKKWMTKEQVESVLQKFADQFCNEINNLNKKLDKLASQAQSLGSRREAQDDNLSQSNTSSEELKRERVQQVLREERKQDTKEDHPSYSGYTPKDVSIEKFFYFGTK